jgi:hypothetical protein
MIKGDFSMNFESCVPNIVLPTFFKTTFRDLPGFFLLRINFISVPFELPLECPLDGFLRWFLSEGAPGG